MNRILISSLFVIVAWSFLHSQESCTRICNSDFEDSIVTQASHFVLTDASNLGCWETTASDQTIEVWGSGFYGVLAYSGQQFIELNANEVSTLFQNLAVIPGETLIISFAHRGRAGTDSLSVSIGEQGGNFDVIGIFGAGNTEWVYNTVSYVVPNNASLNYQIKFNSVSSVGGSTMGNFLDAISVNSSNQLNIETVLMQANCEHLGNIEIQTEGFYGQLDYDWSPAVSTNNQASNLQGGTYTISVTDELGCNLTVSVDLIDYHVDTLQLKDSICYNDSYAFFDEELSTSGIYSHALKNVDNCDSIVYLLDLKKFEEEQLIIENTSNFITFNHEDFDSYFFIRGQDTIFDDTIFVLASGVKDIELHALKNGCEQIRLVDLMTNGEVILPTIFTPNLDDKNDSYTLLGNYVGPIKVLIFNRWGNKIFTFEGEIDAFKWQPESDVSEGVYFIEVEYLERREQGVIQIIRD